MTVIESAADVMTAGTMTDDMTLVTAVRMTDATMTDGIEIDGIVVVTAPGTDALSDQAVNDREALREIVVAPKKKAAPKRHPIVGTSQS